VSELYSLLLFTPAAAVDCCAAATTGCRRGLPALPATTAETTAVTFIGSEREPPQATRTTDIRMPTALAAGHGPSGRAHCIELNRQLMSAGNSLAPIVAVVLQHSPTFNAVNAATALQRIAKVVGAVRGAGGGDPWSAVRAVCERALQLLRLHVPTATAAAQNLWQPRQLSTALWALARLRQISSSADTGSGVQARSVPVPPDRTSTAAQRRLSAELATEITCALGRAGAFRAQEISNCVWACGRLGMRNAGAQPSSLPLSASCGACFRIDCEFELRL
jgi:hypothetical protein